MAARGQLCFPTEACEGSLVLQGNAWQGLATIVHEARAYEQLLREMQFRRPYRGGVTSPETLHLGHKYKPPAVDARRGTCRRIEIQTLETSSLGPKIPSCAELRWSFKGTCLLMLRRSSVCGRIRTLFGNWWIVWILRK